MNEEQVRWKCRRGMLELDLLLARFVERRYSTLSAEQQRSFIELLEYPDQVLHDLLISGQPAATDAISEIIVLIRQPAHAG